MEFDGRIMAEATSATATLGSFTGDTHVIATANDIDIISRDLTAGVLYVINGDGTAGDADLRIFHQAGHEVKANDDGFTFSEPSRTTTVTWPVPCGRRRASAILWRMGEARFT